MKLIHASRKILVLLIAVPIIVIGLILIPLPGPGVLITFLGLALLGLEFDWARNRAEKIRNTIGEIISRAKADYQRRLDDIDDK